MTDKTRNTIMHRHRNLERNNNDELLYKKVVVRMPNKTTKLNIKLEVRSTIPAINKNAVIPQKVHDAKMATGTLHCLKIKFISASFVLSPVQ